jgi:hypothetical protein
MREISTPLSSTSAIAKVSDIALERNRGKVSKFDFPELFGPTKTEIGSSGISWRKPKLLKF